MRLSAILAVLMVVGFASQAGSQFNPVGGAVGYDPQIGTVMEGTVHDVHPTISHDRRYVQITIGSGVAEIIDITEFETITGGFF